MQQMRPTIGHGKICYLEIPAVDITRSAAFYKDVFGWNIRQRKDGHTSFDDGVGEVSGTWTTGRQPVAGGVLIYIMVDDIEQTVKAVTDKGGVIVQPIGVQAPELTAHFKDPAGNIFGLYQEPVS